MFKLPLYLEGGMANLSLVELIDDDLHLEEKMVLGFYDLLHVS